MQGAARLLADERALVLTTYLCLFFSYSAQFSFLFLFCNSLLFSSLLQPYQTLNHIQCITHTRGMCPQLRQYGSYATTTEMILCCVDDASDVAEWDCANSQTHCQVSAAGVGQRGLSGGGGVCPMCRPSDGEKRGTAQWAWEDTECYAERDCRHAATQSSIYV